MAATKTSHPLAVATPKNFRFGNAIKPVKDLSYVVRWPKCVQLQRKRAILLRKLKIPPALNQFRTTLPRNEAVALFALLAKYRPETAEQRKQRLLAEAEARNAGAAPKHASKKTLVCGLDEVTKLVETKKARLVVIACDVQPIELVCWLPTLCQKMQVPYCIVKDKSRLGLLLHRKTAAVVALAEVSQADVAALKALTTAFAPQFIDNADARRRWGN
uniref:60S ribosomal protein L7a n=1 Tax=Dermatophagoides pteronyssinus TaxID=6956 RepID=A0A6P6Y7C8_DERPT|nr:60S ribosomal protein L8-like [Dermatophagoides pteronyssinus]